MARPVLTIDTKGAIHDPSLKLQWLLSYFITTERSQTNLFGGRCLSLPDINRKYIDDPPVYRKTLEEAFKRLLDVYFDDVQTFVNEEPLDDPGKMKLTIKANVLQEGQWYGLSESLIVSQDKVQRVAELYTL